MCVSGSVPQPRVGPGLSEEEEGEALRPATTWAWCCSSQASPLLEVGRPGKIEDSQLKALNFRETTIF